MPKKTFQRLGSAFFSILMGTAVVLSACSGGTTETTSGPVSQDSSSTLDATSNKEKIDGGEIITYDTFEHEGWIKLYTRNLASSNIQELVFNGLYRLTDKQDIEPDLADGLPVPSPDFKELTVKMRKDIKFSDGHPLTADDVVFSYNIPINDDYVGSRKSTFDKLEKIEKVDDSTVRFIFTEPYIGYNGMLTHQILPQHVLKDVPVKELTKSAFFKDKPIGSGPYKLVEWRQGQYLTFTRNETYFKSIPSIEKITIKIIPDSNVAMAQLQTGEINLSSVSGENVEVIKEYAEKSGKIKLQEGIPTTSYTYIGWNTTNPLFKDKLVRQALTTAIDRQTIIDSVLEGQGVLIHSQTPPPFWNYTEDVPKFPYDEEKAKQMLAEAGWKPGSDGILVKDGKRFAFEMLVSQGSKARQKIATVVQQELRKVGIEMTPRVMESSAYAQNVHDKKFEAVINGWNRNGDSNPKGTWDTASIEGGSNYISYSNPDVDRLIEEDSKTLDINKRKELLAKIDALIAEDQGYTFLYASTSSMAYPINLEGYSTKWSGLKRIEDWYFTK
ncbi:peptide-binding protein [Brevibacillus ruminantium]|uniref:Peptide-binding protein n=1 Tax=Brevibacillus ruminantium TaxID=2950604 RepID=A0ABY4WM68_9BACL|nr:peptide-binding protein [Brevibacillus ruminantium]USG68263.1 peptide-binding protein [Brevibacillus ruminantium]